MTYGDMWFLWTRSDYEGNSCTSWVQLHRPYYSHCEHDGTGPWHVRVAWRGKSQMWMTHPVARLEDLRVPGGEPFPWTSQELKEAEASLPHDQQKYIVEIRTGISPILRLV